MLQILIFAGIVAAGLLFLRFGPQSWRTVILHGAMVLVGGLGAILDGLGALDWRSVFDPATAAAIMIAISVLGLIYRIYTTAPVGVPAPPAPPSA